MTDLTARYRAIADEVLRIEEEEARRSGDEMDSIPRPPASDEAIALAEKKRGGPFHESFRSFLRAFDGWDHFAWGTSLFGTKELSGKDYDDAVEVFTYGDDPLPKELAKALVIGASENDASRVLLLQSGKVVDWMYEEEERWPDLATYLAKRKDVLLEMREDARAKALEVLREWDPAFRKKEDRELEVELRDVLRKSAPVAKAAKPKPRSRPPKAVAPADLVLKKGKKVLAEVGLGLMLYLGAAPTKDEVMATYRAFRRRFPAKGTLKWLPASSMGFITHTAKDPDGDVLDEVEKALRVDDEGHFGLRAQIDTAGSGIYLLNVRGLPPEDAEGEEDAEDEEDEEQESVKVPRASFVEVFVPPQEDPAALEALCHDLLDILPVRSGHGGWFVEVRDPHAEPDPYDTVFEWCRRFLGVEVAYVDIWLVGARRRLRGAGWLTVLGVPFVKALGALRFSKAIARHDGKHGVVLRAGKHPPIGDVWRGEFPADIAEVARAIEPLVITRRGKHGMFSVGGVYFSTFTSELGGAFADHHATGAHLHRFTHPEGLTGPTPREEAEAMIEALSKDAYKEWLKAKKSHDDGFGEVLRLLYNASNASKSTKALELAARYPEWAPAQVYNNLLIAYFKEGRTDDAMAVMPVALQTARDNPHTYHSAACILVRAGKLDDALECVKLAKERGYVHFAKMETDADLAPIAKRKAFRDLFTST